MREVRMHRSKDTHLLWTPSKLRQYPKAKGIMFHQIGKWLAPPTSLDEEQIRSAALLNAILMGLALWMGLGLLINFLLGVVNQANFLIGLPSIGLIFVLRWLGQRGRVRLATLLTSTFLLTLVTVSIYNLGTIRTILLGYYFIAFIIPTLLIGPRVGMVFAGLCILATGGLMTLELAGMLPEIAAPTAANQLVVFTEVVLILFALPYLARRTMVKALEHVQSEIVERRRAEEAVRLSEGRLSLFLQYFQGIAYQVKIIDPQTKQTIFMQGTLQDITGYAAKDFENGTVEWFRLIHPDDMALVAAESQKLLSIPGYVADNEYRIYDRSGSIHWVRDIASIAFFEAENTKLLQGAIYDITDPKRAEAELREHREHLELLVTERAAELRAANEQLEALSRVKDDFVSNVSHELRTPIASLKVQQHLLKEKPEQLPKYLAAMQRETDRLHRTIESLLHLSRLDQGRIEPKLVPVSLNQLVEQYVHDRTPLAEEKGLTLTHFGSQGLPFVSADPELLGEVLSILLTNAISYTPAPGHIRVSTQTRRQSDGIWAGFCVSDTGPGISPEEHEHLFERFFRGRLGRQSGTPGTGLGLALAREIIERHKGQIECQNQPEFGYGAAFSVWLPVIAE